MEKRKKLKRYAINIDGIENPMDLISLVADPAIEVTGYAFNKANQSLQNQSHHLCY